MLRDVLCCVALCYVVLRCVASRGASRCVAWGVALRSELRCVVLWYVALRGAWRLPLRACVRACVRACAVLCFCRGHVWH